VKNPSITVQAFIKGVPSQVGLSPNEFIWEDGRHFILTKEPTQYSYNFNLTYQKFGDQYYLYDSGKNVMIEWIKAIGMLFLNLVHNLIFKIIVPLVVALLKAVGVKFDQNVERKCDWMIDKVTPLKTMGLMIPQFFVNLASILSFGIFSVQLNEISGYLEMESLGVSANLLKKKKFKDIAVNIDYAAPCQFARGVSSVPLKDKQVVNILDICDKERLHSFVPKIIAKDLNYTSLDQNKCNFS